MKFFALLFFSLDSSFFPHIKTLLKVSDLVFEKNPERVSNLKETRSLGMAVCLEQAQLNNTRLRCVAAGRPYSKEFRALCI